VVILPKDLASALGHLSDNELKTLDAAVHDEIAKRKLKPRAETRETPLKEKPLTTSMQQKSRIRRAPSATDAQSVPLTQSRINAIRAAFRAGVKPSAISRQFCVSLSTIQRALKGDDAQ